MNNLQSFIFLLLNVLWMGWNILLAFVSIYLARLLYRSRSPIISTLLFFCWIIFVPNTLYMITDGIHVFSYNFNSMTSLFWTLGIALYAVVISLAVYTFVRATHPVLMKYHNFLHTCGPKTRYLLFAMYASLVGFAIAMGRFQRTNTWYIFTQPMRVVRDVIDSITDPTVVFIALCYSIGAFVIILFTDRHTD